MNHQPLHGLIAATYTPLKPDGSLQLELIPALVEDLLSQQIRGLYVCGSTGEGMSLTTAERQQVAQAYTTAAAGRLPVIVQVGHNSVDQARELAAHAQEIGADVVSATCPSYFRVGDVDTLIECMQHIAAGAPELPFYYYHIPMLTGSTLDMVDFLTRGSQSIPTLVGLKYTDTKLYEFQNCLELASGRFDVVWGCDEMLLGALATGGRGAIGSTYNIAAPLYNRLIAAVEQADLVRARELQSLAVRMIDTIGGYPFHAAMKAILTMRGLPVGGCRLPQGKLSEAQSAALKTELQAIGFFEWSRTTQG